MAKVMNSPEARLLCQKEPEVQQLLFFNFAFLVSNSNILTLELQSWALESDKCEFEFDCQLRKLLTVGTCPSHIRSLSPVSSSVTLHHG